MLNIIYVYASINQGLQSDFYFDLFFLVELYLKYLLLNHKIGSISLIIDCHISKPIHIFYKFNISFYKF